MHGYNFQESVLLNSEIHDPRDMGSGPFGGAT